jgi:hypothetical protein
LFAFVVPQLPGINSAESIRLRVKTTHYHFLDPVEFAFHSLYTDADSFAAMRSDLQDPLLSEQPVAESPFRARPFGRYAADLRGELSARNLSWAAENGFPHERTTGSLSSVIFRPDEEGRHGNFHPASYQRILRNLDWSRRLSKKHTTARKCLVSHDSGRGELDSCNSSDALLMNIFCHPSASSGKSALRLHLAIDSAAYFVFGYKPRIPLKNAGVDRTEVDLRIGELLIEAKLTESDFQVAPWKLAERYRDFEETFDPELLPKAGKKLHSYQLVRGILAAFASEGGRYCLICDDRRKDLLELWCEILGSIRRHDQRWRCVLVTWQELSRTLPKSLQIWLQRKYGITAHGPNQDRGFRSS